MAGAGVRPDRTPLEVDRLVAWLGFCGWFIFSEWNSIRYFALGDTDDNMRIMQVRGLLHGQGWFDLRQYRMNPPFGANIHWSRLVDLPIAGLILLLRPILGGAGAERWAVAIAPLLPYLLLLYALALTARRLVDPRAYPLAFLALFFAGSANGMFMPERIDHHGWQLALLALSMSAIADPKRVRGGLTLGIASALSLAIGLEMLIYIAVMGVATALFWVADADERDGCALMRSHSAERRRSRFSPSLPMPTGRPCATPCRRCGCPMCCSAEPCFTDFRCFRSPTGGKGWRSPLLAGAARRCVPRPDLAATACSGSKAFRPRSIGCG